MSDLPPLPPGFTLGSGAPRRRDPWEVLQAEGFVATNGFRTDRDVERIRAQGYKPAIRGAHNRGDGVDLTHPRLSPARQAKRLRELSMEHGWDGAVVLDEGHHRHMAIPGWGAAPGTPGTKNSGLPPLPAGASLEQRGSLSGGNFVTATDGDTVKLSTGQSGRVKGVDAWELAQQGRRPDGSLVPLGRDARDFLNGVLPPSAPIMATGGTSYGRPIVTLGTGDADPAASLLRSGHALASPRHLQGDERFGPYMEAERLARQNLLGGHGTNAETPGQFRRKDGPWQGAEPGKWGAGQAVFADERTPFQGLRPEIEQAYIALASDPKSTADDLAAFASANGFEIRREDAEKFIRRREKGEGVTPKIIYEQAPRPITDVGDGAAGAAVRGLADPFNVIDELGAVPDTLGLPTFGGPRENVWNSDRRFGDILWNNIDQNRAIIAHDDMAHPIARFGGQLASGVALPYGAGARTVGQLARLGAAEGAVAGLGAGEGGLLQRLPGAVAGTAIGAAGGAALGKAAQGAGKLWNAARRLVRREQAVPEPTRGPHGPIHFDLADNYPAALERLRKDQSGEIPGAIQHPDIGDVDLVWGNERYGLAHIIDQHPEVVDELPSIVEKLPVRQRPEETGNNRFVLEDDLHRAIVSPDFDGVEKRWLVTAFERKSPGGQTSRRDPLSPDGGSTGAGSDDIGRVGPSGNAAMRVESGGPELVGPAVDDLPPIPEGFTLEPSIGRTLRTDERPSPEQLAQLAEGVDPRSVLPRPSNIVEDLAEAQRANPGTVRQLEAPDEFAELNVRRIPSAKDVSRWTSVRGPLDLTQTLRTYGGIRDEGGNLRHLGIDGKPRRMDFGSNEQFLGRLINNDDGLSLDEAAHRLWEEGYFPEFKQRLTPDDLLERLHAEAMGTQRFFHPDTLDEVARFEAAQAERFRIERAEAEGSPLAERVGETITLDDLVENAPPAEAYEEMPRLVGKVGNINLAHLEKPQDVARLIEQIQSRVGGFSAAARGRVTHEETRRLADELGLKPQQLLSRRQGQALNAEQLYATRALVQKSREMVGKLAQKAVGGSDEDLATFRKAWLKHVAIEEQVAGATAEAGRALQQFRMLAQASDAGAEAIRAYLKGGGGRETVEDAAQAIIDLMEDPARANHFMREAVKPRWRDKLNELWINSLLSGPKTHVVNFVGNAVTTLMSLPEQALTAGIGKVLRSHDRALIGEVGARVMGLADGAVEGLRRARKAFATGEPSDAVSKVEAAHYQAIGGKAGQIIRIPTRALTASDEWWKSVNASAELRALAYREATRTTANPLEWQQRYAELLRDPPEAMVKTAQNAARYYTFQKELGDSGKAIQRWANTWPGAKLILPFVRTPINLLKFAGERSVFAMVMPEVRAALKAGGRQRDEALAKITLGSGLSTAAVMAALEGKVSGGGPH